MLLEDLQFKKLEPGLDCTSFDCDDLPINEFIYTEAIDYQNENFGNTYVFYSRDGIVRAYFTISNDSIKDLGDNRSRNRFNRKNSIPNVKRTISYPAIKIGRFGVHKEQQGCGHRGLAYQLMDFIKGWVIKDHKPAVRFLVLDSYNQPKNLKFYGSNQFETLNIDADTERDTVFMYYPLSRLA